MCVYLRKLVSKSKLTNHGILHYLWSADLSKSFSQLFVESAKLRALRANNVLACQRALRAYVLTCQRALRAYVLTCQRALHAYVPYVLTCQNALCAYVLVCKCAILNNVNLYIIQIC